MTDRSEFLARLEAVHSFPETYMFKVIGENTEDFVLRVVQAATLAVGPGDRLELKTRESSAGRHVAVTLLAMVDDAEMVLDVYELVGKVEGVRFIA